MPINYIFFYCFLATTYGNLWESQSGTTDGPPKTLGNPSRAWVSGEKQNR